MAVTTIGTQTLVEGRLEGDEDVTVQGRVVGAIEISESVFVAEGGHVSGDIVANTVVVEGVVEGTIKARHLLHLAASARVKANIAAPSIRMDDGAALSGEVDMDLSTAPSKPKSRPAQTSAPAPAQKPARSPIAKEPAKAVNTTKVVNTTKAVNADAPTSTTTTVVEETEAMDDFESFTVRELRDRLKEHDLPIKGTKAELIKRLANA